jgi:hypothetical protein
MSIAKGAKSGLVWKEETTYGTAPSGNFTGLTFSNESLIENINTIRSEEIRPDRTMPALRGGNVSAGGSISCDFAIDRFGIWLKHLLAASVATTTVTVSALAAQAYVRGDLAKSNGNVYLCVLGGTITTVGGGLTHTSGYASIDGVKWEYLCADTTSVYQHVFTAGTSMPAGGISMEKQVLGGSAERYIMFRGGRINALDLTVPQEGIIQAAWSLLFKDTNTPAATTAGGTPSYTMEDPVSGYEAFVSFGASNLNRPVRQMSLRISNNFEEDVFALGERIRRELPERRREVTGSLTTYFEDSTEYDNFRNESVVNVLFSMNRLGEFLKFDLGEVKFTGTGTPQIGGPGVVTGTYELTAFKQSGTYDIKATLLSLQATLR